MTLVAKNVVKIVVLSLLVMAVLSPGVLRAQQSPMEVDNAPTVIGILVGVAPDYIGSSDYKGVAAPFLKYTLSGSNQYLLLAGTQLSFNLINDPSFRFGPVLNYRPERSDVENNRVDRMTNIDAALEGGAFIGYECIDKNNPRQRSSFTLTWTADMSGVYNGWLVTGVAKTWLPIAKNWDLGLSISGTYGDNAYTDKYFGVDPIDAIRAPFRRYNASSGFRDVSGTPSVIYHVNQNWSIAGGARYSRLLDDAANSPLVDVGSKDQLTVGAGVLYSWK